MTEDQKRDACRDRNLLFGVIAVQLHFITPVDLARAAAAWSADPGPGLDAALARMNLIKARDREVINQLLDLQISAHQGDASATLAAFGGRRAVEASFAASPEGPAAAAFDSDLGECLPSFGGGMTPPAQTRPGLHPGERLDDAGRITSEHPGRYTIKGEQGRGGIGCIYLAFDEHIGREVALKELLPERPPPSGGASPSPLRVTAQTTARFLREARITGQLEHPAIVPVYELGRKGDGSIYYTMKLVRGDTLAKRLKQAKTISERLKLLPHYLDLCQAMAFAHSRGVIHRDLKPQNVMVGKFGETVVLDWGLAKVRGIKDARADDLERGIELIKEAAADETVKGSPIGTPSYMSPEQAEGLIEEVDERSDVFSLGAVLYEILTGRPPFIGDTAYEVLGKALTEEVSPARELEPKSPSELSAIAGKCLARRREDRYQHAGELAEDIANFESGGLVSAYEYSARELIGRWVRRRWPILATAGAGIIVLLVVAVSFVLQLSSERDRTVQSLSEAYYQYGLRSEEGAYWDQARVYYAKSLALTGREDARRSLYRAAMRPLRASLLEIISVPEGVEAVSFSPDSGLFAAGGGDKAVRVWRTGDRSLVHTLHGHNRPAKALAFSPDGRLLASGGADRAIMIWDLREGVLVRTLTGHSDAVSALAFSPDGELLLSGSWDSTLRVWRVKTGELEARLIGHQGFVSAAAFTPDGTRMVSGSGDRSLKLWSLGGGDCLMTFSGHEDAVWSLALLPEGLMASAALDGSLRLWSLESMTNLWAVAGHEGPIYALAASPDGRHLFSAGRDRALRIWGLPAGELMNAALAHDDEILCLAASPDGKYALSGSRDQGLGLWRLDRLEAARSQQISPANAMTVSPDGALAAIGGDDASRTLRIWSLDTGVPGERLRGHEQDISALVFSPDKVRLAAADAGGKIKLWSLATGKPERTLEGHRDEVTSLSFSPNGERLLSASKDGTVRLWAVPSGESLKTFQDQSWWGRIEVRLSPAGDQFSLIGTAENEVLICELETGKCGLKLRADNPLLDLAFSPDGKQAATAGCLDYQAPECRAGELRLWSLETGELTASLEAHQDEVTALEFSPDGKYLITGSRDSSVKMWDLKSKRCIMTFPLLAAPVALARFTSDGRRLIAMSEDGAIVILPLRWELFSRTGPDLLEQAEKETRLRLDGFNLVPDRLGRSGPG